MFLIERTLILLKPDALQRSITGKIISRLEDAGLKIVGMKMVWVDKEFSREHYAEHVEKPFYKGLEALITMGPVIAMAIEGVEAIETVRKMVGATEPKSSLPGTIRGDYAHVSYGHADKHGIGIKNLIHASANTEDAKKEVSLWFEDKEMHSYDTVHDAHTTK
ncbi:nucleoside-diphosphate kinase [Candidatus Woesearchaeota archaeon]|nr:nucleoside-diphosphate kinase [Candidatus Woesearchaeota archaeon]